MAALNIKNPVAHRLAQELADATGETLTEAVTTALRERLRAIRQGRGEAAVRARIREIQDFVASLPVLDARDPDEILYDEHGLPR